MNLLKGYVPMFLVIILVILSSCQLNRLEEPILIAEVDKEFEIDILEGLSLGLRPLHFKINSLDQEECLNYGIETDYYKSGNKISLSIKDILQPDDCLVGNSPAQTDLNLGFLTPGIYDLSIDLKNTVFSDGQLVLTDNRYTIKTFSQNGISFINKELIKLPDNLVWGYLNYQSETDLPKVNQFLDDLSNSIGDPTLALNGNYGYFKTDNVGSVSIKAQPESGETISFAGNIIGEVERIKEKASKFREDNPTIELFILTSFGDSY